ncbi:MAG: hypothetical protein AAGA75_00935 [Cyanobacteria bacterium P01_E01_bin.6]
MCAGCVPPCDQHSESLGMSGEDIGHLTGRLGQWQLGDRPTMARIQFEPDLYKALSTWAIAP